MKIINQKFKNENNKIYRSYQNNHILIVPLNLAAVSKKEQQCLRWGFHWRFLLDYHPKVHLRRFDANFHTFSSTAEPFA